ncbi:transglutaminase family protein [Roseateles sp. UC29_93]|uniref:transglutaminase-like domain-containing protein n=1 Tax=Roseateles sp. UC29_93 TaxID=3350177 RepID=UPI003670A1BF
MPDRSVAVELLSYLAPSRYCESDRLIPWAEAEFGHLPSGYARAAAIAAWVQRHIAYSSYGSTTQTTALDTLTDRVGVCRDQAHVMIALCRALSLPARYVTGTDYGADPTKAPDFHAYVEVYLGRRWYTFDASGTGIPMGFVRIGTGRDAADVPFATLYGQVQAPFAPLVRASACEGPGLRLPVHVSSALSTDGDSAGCHLAPAAA